MSAAKVSFVGWTDRHFVNKLFEKLEKKANDNHPTKAKGILLHIHTHIYKHVHYVLCPEGGVPLYGDLCRDLVLRLIPRVLIRGQAVLWHMKRGASDNG